MSSVLGLLGGISGGGSIGSAVVRLTLDTAGYSAQLAAAEGETKAATASAEKSTKDLASTSELAYGAAALAAVSFYAASIQAAAEHQQVLAQLTATVGSNTQAFEEQATALQNVSGFQDEAILSADTILARFKLTDEQVRATIPTVLDYARATGKAVPEAAGLIGKALLGNTRALKAVGISYKSTGDAAQDYAAIQDLLNQKLAGQAAAYATTYAGKLEILKAKFDDFEEVVGGPLIQDLTNLADSLNIVADAGGKLASVLPGGTTGVNLLHAALVPLSVVTEYNARVLGFFGDKLGITTDDTEGLTQSAGGLTDALAGMSEEEYAAATASTHLSGAQKDLKNAVSDAGDGILHLTTTIKDTFNISQKEMDKGFSQMLASAVRFKRDLKILDNLDVGLSPSQTAKFETFLVSEGPGYVDRFVRASASRQAAWVQEWLTSIGKVRSGLNVLSQTTATPQVNTSSIDAAAQKLHGLQEALSRGL